MLKRESAMEKPTLEKLACCRRLGPVRVPIRFRGNDASLHIIASFNLHAMMASYIKDHGQENYKVQEHERRSM